MNAVASHFPDELLERYAMGKLCEEESAPLEEHLFICAACRDRLEALDEFIQVTKAALAICQRTAKSTGLSELRTFAIGRPSVPVL